MDAPLNLPYPLGSTRLAYFVFQSPDLRALSVSKKRGREEVVFLLSAVLCHPLTSYSDMLSQLISHLSSPLLSSSPIFSPLLSSPLCSCRLFSFPFIFSSLFSFSILSYPLLPSFSPHFISPHISSPPLLLIYQVCGLSLSVCVRKSMLPSEPMTMSLFIF